MARQGGAHHGHGLGHPPGVGDGAGGFGDSHGYAADLGTTEVVLAAVAVVRLAYLGLRPRMKGYDA
jgi:hypothetical protein